MSYYGWKPYVSVAQRRLKAEKEAAKARKAGAVLTPIAPSRGAIGKTFWGKAWCDNLETYSDYSNRLPRGRTYARNGSVIDLKISVGEIHAQVMGSSLYKVAINVMAVPVPHWKAIGSDCAGSIDSLVELLQGKLSTAVMQRICKPQSGLFPAPKEISFRCSCPDSAAMCKHIAAVLYGVGARLDQQPELLFGLRQVDAKDLISQAGAGLPQPKGPAADRVLDAALLADVFGIEMDETPVAVVKKPAASRKTATAKKPAAATKQGAVKKSVTGKKLVTLKKLVAVTPPAAAKSSSKQVAAPRKPSPAKMPTGKTGVKPNAKLDAKATVPVALPVKKNTGKTS